MNTQSVRMPANRSQIHSLAILALLAVLTTGCGADGAATGAVLEGSRWEMTSVRDGGRLVGAHPTTIATVEFVDGKAFGSTGCNKYQFPYAINADSISFGEPALTGSACHPDYVDQSDAFVRAMLASTGVSLTGDTLELTDAAGSTQMAFRPASELPLGGVSWQLVWFGEGTAPLEGTQISLTFRDDRTLTGIAGCNSYSANYQADGDRLVIEAIARTEMACTDPDGVMAQETDYLTAISSAAGFTTSLTGMEVTDFEGDVAAAFRFAGRIR